MDLLTLLAACTFTATSPSPDLMYSVVYETSEGREWYIEDVSAGRAYTPATRAEAVQLAGTLREQGHEVHIGLAGVRVSLLRSYGVTLEAAFDPCTNVQVASEAIHHAAGKCGGLSCGLRSYWSSAEKRSARGWAKGVLGRRRIDVDAALADPESSVPNPRYSTSTSVLVNPSQPQSPSPSDGMLVEPREPATSQSPDSSAAGNSRSHPEDSSSEKSPSQDSSSSSEESSREESGGRAQPDVTDEKLDLKKSDSEN